MFLKRLSFDSTYHSDTHWRLINLDEAQLKNKFLNYLWSNHRSSEKIIRALPSHLSTSFPRIEFCFGRYWHPLRGQDA